MKKIFVFSLLVFSVTKLFSQIYEVRRVDEDHYGRTLNETARYMGNMQDKMQAKYDANYQKINTKIRSIDKIIGKFVQRHKNGEESLEEEVFPYIRIYNQNLKKIERINMMDNSEVLRVLNYLDDVESQLYNWL
jgi:hypothetical protein